MAKRNRWKHERRTGLDLVRVWVEGQKNQAEAARVVGMSPQRLWGFLNVEDRGLDPDGARVLARAAGIPFEAVMFKHERICDAVKGADGDEAAA